MMISPSDLTVPLEGQDRHQRHAGLEGTYIDIP